MERNYFIFDSYWDRWDKDFKYYSWAQRQNNKINEWDFFIYRKPWIANKWKFYFYWSWRINNIEKIGNGNRAFLWDLNEFIPIHQTQLEKFNWTFKDKWNSWSNFFTQYWITQINKLDFENILELVKKKEKKIKSIWSNIVLQPCWNKGSREHYNDTIINRVSLEQIKPYINKNEHNELEKIYPSWDCSIWWVTPSSSNVTKWSRIKRWDVTLFSRSWWVFASGVTTYKLHNKVLAAMLWNINSTGETWEYIYFLDEIKNHNIPYIKLNQSIWYADNYVIQWFNVLDDEKSEKALRDFDLGTEIYFEEIPKDKFIDANIKLDNLKETDKLIQSYSRTEQWYLKKNLLWDSTNARCACCKNEFPISYLITAHIKKRSECNRQERLDTNIVMPMCLFWCDELYEKGYISVKDGIFVSLNKKPVTSFIDEYIWKIIWNNCEYYNKDRRKYFDWHLDYHW